MIQTTAKVVDLFEIRAGTPGVSTLPGVVVVIRPPKGKAGPKEGEYVTIRRPSGGTRTAVVEQSKSHGEGRSFYVRNLKKSDFPTGVTVAWPAILMDRKLRKTRVAVAG